MIQVYRLKRLRNDVGDTTDELDGVDTNTLKPSVILDISPSSTVASIRRRLKCSNKLFLKTANGWTQEMDLKVICRVDRIMNNVFEYFEGEKLCHALCELAVNHKNAICDRLTPQLSSSLLQKHPFQAGELLLCLNEERFIDKDACLQVLEQRYIEPVARLLLILKSFHHQKRILLLVKDSDLYYDILVKHQVSLEEQLFLAATYRNDVPRVLFDNIVIDDDSIAVQLLEHLLEMNHTKRPIQLIYRHVRKIPLHVLQLAWDKITDMQLLVDFCEYHADFVRSVNRHIDLECSPFLNSFSRHYPEYVEKQGGLSLFQICDSSACVAFCNLLASSNKELLIKLIQRSKGFNKLDFCAAYYYCGFSGEFPVRLSSDLPTDLIKIVFFIKAHVEVDVDEEELAYASRFLRILSKVGDDSLVDSVLSLLLRVKYDSCSLETLYHYIVSRKCALATELVFYLKDYDRTMLVDLIIVITLNDDITMGCRLLKHFPFTADEKLRMEVHIGPKLVHFQAFDALYVLVHDQPAVQRKLASYALETLVENSAGDILQLFSTNSNLRQKFYKLELANQKRRSPTRPLNTLWRGKTSVRKSILSNSCSKLILPYEQKNIWIPSPAIPCSIYKPPKEYIFEKRETCLKHMEPDRRPWKNGVIKPKPLIMAILN